MFFLRGFIAFAHGSLLNATQREVLFTIAPSHIACFSEVTGSFTPERVQGRGFPCWILELPAVDCVLRKCGLQHENCYLFISSLAQNRRKRWEALSR